MNLKNEILVRENEIKDVVNHLNRAEEFIASNESKLMISQHEN